MNKYDSKIQGLLRFGLDVIEDERGWFKESFQREKLLALGLPSEFVPVQNNVSSNKLKGVTRGIHAEPWNKYISLSRGRAFVAIVDLRIDKDFGRVETFEITPHEAFYLPAGCGNSFQVLENDTDYTYLTDAHWYPNAKYTMVNLADKTLNINWPIPLDLAILSDKDKKHPEIQKI